MYKIMNDWLESHNDTSGLNKVLEKSIPNKNITMLKHHLLYIIQVIKYHIIGLFPEKWNP